MPKLIATKNTPDNYPMNACTGTNACNDMGECKLAVGETCNDNTDCGSVNCVNNMGTKKCQP